MSRVLLIVPPEPLLKDLKQSGSKWPRIGLAYVAAYLRQHGADVQVLDCKAQDLDQAGAAGRIAQIQPDFVGIGPFTEEIHEAYRVCQAAKRINPRIVTVFGGPHASALPERTLRECPDLDVVVCGEGEATMLDLVNGVDAAHVKGAACRRDGQVVVNGPREQIEDVDSLPYPAWDLFPLDAYRGILTLHLREKINRPALELPILSARGCPYRCNFCYKTYGGLRNRDPIKIVDELEYDMGTFGASEFFFVEGTFAADRRQGLQICDEIVRRGLASRIRWIVETRVNVVSEELLARMKEAGCRQVEFGVETGDEEILRQTQKGTTLEQVRQAVSLAKKAGLKVGCYFIIGHPNETRESIGRTYRFARELDPDLMNVGIMIPYPGTQVRALAEQGHGGYRLLCDDWSEYTKQRGGPLELQDLSLGELQKIQSRAYIAYYLRPAKLWFVLRSLSPGKIGRIIRSLLRAAVRRT
jgi:radical SAM superfamily enzyme YgiQ (UPF0313 family)